MSSNKKVIEVLYQSFKAKDYEKFAQICDKNLCWRQNPGFPNGQIYSGVDEVIKNVFMSFSDEWMEWKFEIIDMIEAGELVIVTGTYQATHISTGKHFVSEAAHFYQLESGKIISFQQYADTKVIWDAMV